MFKPGYLKLHKTGELKKRVKKAYQILSDCTLCPHRCHVDRTQGEIGYCKTGEKVKIASYGAHFGEETPLVGKKGSGTIFFSNCNLRCVYCQNYDISHQQAGEEISTEELADTMLALQQKGCHNINFVTPSHVIHALLKTILKAVEKGLEIPLIYNSGGYDDIKALQLLDGVIDIYMPDIKYIDEKTALEYSGIENYPEIVKKALKEMYNQVGNLKTNQGIAYKGLLVRHLILPNNLAGTKEILKFIAKEISSDTYVNLMDQYYPTYKAGKYKELSRRITQEEFSEALNFAKQVGLKKIKR